jgi:threonine 3-dehydrogenase
VRARYGGDHAVVETTWAIRKVARRPGLVLDEVPVPAVREDEVLVRVEAASVCGTDLHIYHWDPWSARRITPPVTLGHELAGTVVEVGTRVASAAVGDFVSAESHVTCGACFFCRTGRAHMCEHTRIIGVDRDGALAGYVALPESIVWQNDRARLSPEIAALQEPFGNAVFATDHAELAGRTAAVLGCGPVGLFAVAVARASGAGRVLAADRAPFRLALARELGAEALDIDASDDVPGWFHERNEGEGVDVVFEMSGAPAAVADAFRIARNGGQVILFGIPAHPVEIDVAEALIFKNLTVSAVNGRRVWETWYKTRWLLEHGVVDLAPLVTDRLPFADFEDAFARLDAGEACKIVLYPDGAGETVSAVPEAAPAREPTLALPGRWMHR